MASAGGVPGTQFYPPAAVGPRCARSRVGVISGGECEAFRIAVADGIAAFATGV